MAPIDRREFVGATALGRFTLLPDRAGTAQPTNATSPYVPDNVTRTLAAYVVNARPDNLPATVRAEACRTLLNWAGCTVGGSRHAPKSGRSAPRDWARRPDVRVIADTARV